MRKLNVKLTGKAKKVVISVSAGVAAAAIVAGIVFGLRGRGEPVGVYPFTMVGMTEFWGDNQESYGPVTTDRIQTVFLSDTQTVTEVLVKEGDTVKKGDVLMTYDTTLSELELERKRLDVEKAKLQVKEAEEELARINKLEPMGDVDI
ncbi:MAG: biotin/lipoyl-binding protein, partial [Clostridiales bacterium]|nr:biotin/lipoyl-binding protein [Clostridiales bacterium]